MIKVKTNKGDLTIQLDFDNTPNTATNFLRCVEEGYFDGTIFHRVIDGFMIQGGGFEPGMVKKPSRAPIDNEANKAKSNKRGSLAMARTTDPHSASTQFFINVKDNSFLDHSSEDVHGWGYCVFGEVVDGLDVVDKIKVVETTRRAGHDDVPVVDVIIESMTVSADACDAASSTEKA